MGTYRLIAFDMDGTLFDSNKRISPRTLGMIGRAFDAGKEVVLDTGRCIPELRETFAAIPRLRYAVCGSGALVYDVQNARALHSCPIAPETALKILAAAQQEAPMVHILAGESVVETQQAADMARYDMGEFQPFFKGAARVDDIYAWYRNAPFPVEKLNLYHTSAESRARTRERLAPLGLSLADAEHTSLECSAPGVDKGTGLSALCRILGIPPAECIAVGDADNDVPMLRTAGLALAMGNANAHARDAAHHILPDNDHDGCAEAIAQFLL